MTHSLLALLLCWQSAPTHDVGPLVHALWIMQAKAHGDVVSPAQDRQLKSVLAKALAGDGQVDSTELKQYFDISQFNSLAGKSSAMNKSDLASAAAALVPETRTRMSPAIVQHLDLLTTSFDMIDGDHAIAAQELAGWIAKHYSKDQELHVIMVCTGNSRRSILGSTMGNLAASYYGLPNLHFHSGGTKPSAFNSRTINALQEIGVTISETGDEAPRGDAKTPNPIFQVGWGPGLQTSEFSKLYSDASIPKQGFAALMVCDEADNECPNVPGAALRLSMPFIDPKIYDGSALETAKYAERRDDIGRTLLMAICRARNQMNHP